MLTNCEQCGVRFNVAPFYLKRGQGKFCSHSCASKFNHPRIIEKCTVCKTEFSIPKCRKGITKNCSRKCADLSRKGKTWNLSPEACAKISKYWKGKKKSIEQVLKQSGSNSRFWKGGITPLRQQVYNSSAYKEWRKSVYERDNYTCVLCGSKESGNLNADHIKPFCLYPELRFDINNGRTLCVACHIKTPTYGIKAREYKELVC